jgi:hypothetical protein
VRSKRIGVTVAVVMALSGCADTHEFLRYGNLEIPRLVASDSFYIAVSRDGVYGSRTYQGSGWTTSQILLASFAKRVRRVETSRSSQPFDEALKVARDNGYKYLVFPTILQWEDRATEWSAIPDRVEVKIELIEVTTGKALDSGVIKGKSGLATFGGDHPQDLLPKPIEEYVAKLFGST